MFSSLRAAAQQNTRKTVGTCARYSTQFPSPFAASAQFLNDLDGPPTAQDGYAPASDSSGLNRASLSSIDSLPSQIPHYKLHCHSTRNNTITTFTDPKGMPIAWFSGGSCGFKRGQRATYEAGYQCAVRMFRKIEDIAAEKNIVKLALYFNGFGQGREAMQKALLTSEGANVKGLIEIVGDRTPIKIGGTRSKKRRRL